MTVRPAIPWYSDKIADLREEKPRKHCEKKWRETNLTVHWDAFKEARNAVSREIEKAKHDHFVDQIENCGNDQNALFRVINEIFHTKDKQSLSQHTNLTDLLNSFGDFFQQKIARIRENLDFDSIDSDTATAIASVLPLDELPASFTTFEALTVKEVKKIMAKYHSKSCALDPILTWLLRELGDILATVISKIINLSLQTGCMPLNSAQKAYT